MPSTPVFPEHDPDTDRQKDSAIVPLTVYQTCPAIRRSRKPHEPQELAVVNPGALNQGFPIQLRRAERMARNELGSFFMRKHIALAAALVVGTTGSALAADGLSYDLLEGGYGYADLDNTSTHGDEFSIGGSVGLGERFFGFGSVGTLDVSDLNMTGLTLGAGWHTAISASIDFLAGVSFELLDPEGGGGSWTGYGAMVGLRGNAGDKLELDGGVKYAHLGNGIDGLVFSVGSRYYFTAAFAAGLDISRNEDADTTTFGLMFRYDFGR
jgi:hypothetical protein